MVYIDRTIPINKVYLIIKKIYIFRCIISSTSIIIFFQYFFQYILFLNINVNNIPANTKQSKVSNLLDKQETFFVVFKSIVREEVKCDELKNL